MIEQLFDFIKKDKGARRKRYPDTALEMLRWLIRSVENEEFDWAGLGNKLAPSKRKKGIS